jgi:hypothetical protein
VEVTVAQTGNRSGGRRDHSGLLAPLGALSGLPYHTEHRPSAVTRTRQLRVEMREAHARRILGE